MPWGDGCQCGRLGSGQWLVGGIHHVSGHGMGSRWCVQLFHSCWIDSICILGLDRCCIYVLGHQYIIDCWSFCVHGLWIMLLMWMTWKRCDNWPNRWYSSVPRSNECIAQVVVDQCSYWWWEGGVVWFFHQWYHLGVVLVRIVHVVLSDHMGHFGNALDRPSTPHLQDYLQSDFPIRSRTICFSPVSTSDESTKYAVKKGCANLSIWTT